MILHKLMSFADQYSSLEYLSANWPRRPRWIERGRRSAGEDGSETSLRPPGEGVGMVSAGVRDCWRKGEFPRSGARPILMNGGGNAVVHVVVTGAQDELDLSATRGLLRTGRAGNDPAAPPGSSSSRMGIRATGSAERPGLLAKTTILIITAESAEEAEKYFLGKKGKKRQQ